MRAIEIIALCVCIVGATICVICIGLTSIGTDVNVYVTTCGGIMAIGGWIALRKLR